MAKNYVKKSQEEKRQEVKNIMEQLEQGVAAVFTSDKYKECLSFFSKFHRYSFNNTILIAQQYPAASQVASFAAWQKLGGKIKKGSKAIKVLCPIPYSYKVEVENTKGEIKEKIVSGVRFKLGNVFDISQVEGVDIPKLTKPLKGNSKELKNLIREIRKKSHTPIYVSAALNDKPENGYYNLVEKNIYIKECLDDAHKLKTIIHELAHSILHNDMKNYTREEAEVQAESVAFVVCNAIGIDTKEYSFGYIASWSTGKDIKELKNSLNIIEKTSKQIIEFIEG